MSLLVPSERATARPNYENYEKVSFRCWQNSKSAAPSTNTRDAKFSMTLYDVYDDAQLVDRLEAHKVEKSEQKEQDARLSYVSQPAHRVG